MGLFGRKNRSSVSFPEAAGREPVIRSSICTGEKTACLRDPKTGHIEEICLIRSETEMKAFREKYGVTGEIPTIY